MPTEKTGRETLDVAGTARDKSLQLIVQTGHTGPVLSVAVTRDGKHLASGGYDNTIKLWDIESGKQLLSLKGHKGWVYSVAFNADGKMLASGSWDETIKLWDVESGRELKTLAGHTGQINSVAFSSDGITLASGSADGTIRLWDVASGTHARTLKGHLEPVNSVAFTPDGKALVSGGEDQTIRLWEVAVGAELKVFRGNFGHVYSVAFDAEGKRLACGSVDRTVKLLDLVSGDIKTLKGHSGYVWEVAFSHDGKTLASGSDDGTIKLWDVESGRELKTLTGYSSDGKTSIAFGVGNVLAGGGDGGTVRLWDVESGAQLPTPGEQADASSPVTFSGRLLASVTPANAIKLWDITTGAQVQDFAGHAKEVKTLAFSPDGRLMASAGEDSLIKLWDVASGEQLWTLKGHAGWVYSVAFSADGMTLASGGEDETLRLWEVEGGRELKAIGGQSGIVYSVAFSGGKMLASGSGGPEITFWSRAGQELASLIVLNESDWVVVTPDSRFDTNMSLDNIEGLHWISDEAKLSPLPLEIFMRDYYEPNLLPRLMKCNEENSCDREFKPVRDLTELNRVQPPIRISNVSLPDDGGYVTVTVEVGKGRGEFLVSGKKVTRTSGMYDLRLFRDEQIVGYWPPDGAQKLLLLSAQNLQLPKSMSDEEKLTKDLYEWRRATECTLDSDGHRRLNFRVLLPHGKDAASVEFTAYGFNEDRVKSRTAKWRWPPNVAARLPKARPVKPRAYLINVGVNASESSQWRLRYAANDARLMQKVLSDRLRSPERADGLDNQYEVIAVPLISDYAGDSTTPMPNDATKTKIAAVFRLLAGANIVGDERLAQLVRDVPQASEIKQAEPDDLILISFSSHGYTNRSGDFFILPYDVGPSPEISADLLRRSISSEELSLWMRDVDAGRIVMIVDACHAAAAIQGSGFKPGPMASRGLGQLAFDKGMQILAATQASDAAIESGGSIRQGLLSYALVRDGLERRLANFKPSDDEKITMREWLQYGVVRVPQLYAEITSGRLKAVRGAELVGEVTGGRSYQQPSLFDFTRRQTDLTLAGLRESH